MEPGRIYPYRVDFENQPTASAPAQEVVIRDRLSPHLDWTKFEWTEVGWGDQWITVPPGRRQFSTNVLVTCCGAPFEVHVNLNFSLASGDATAIFRSINPDTGLPPTVEMGFLPPENGTGRGQGHIAYLIQAVPDLPTGTEIRNIASISFDGQPVITTNQRDPHDPTAGTDPSRECLNTLDVAPPSSSVAALPAQLPPGGLVRWSGTDVGSGIANYDIYVSDEGGAWRPWLETTALTSAPLLGTVGHRYRFYSVARDNVGLVETAPAVADAETAASSEKLHRNIPLNPFDSLFFDGKAEGYLEFISFMKEYFKKSVDGLQIPKLF